MSILMLICILIVFYNIYQLYKYFNSVKVINPHNKYILITGCDSGFGLSLAVELDRQGFNVLASVYDARNKPININQLSSNATVFKLDITNQQDIEESFHLVKNKTNHLYGLVNNAGISDGGLIDWVSLQSVRQVFEVNFFGHVAMTKTFLPLLLAEKNSRVINVSSAAGILAAAGASAYSSSKYAIEAFSDCLRREFAAWNLHVAIVEPGFMRTPIIEGIDKKMHSLWANDMDDETRARWGESYFLDWLTRGTDLATQTADDPMKVVRALCHALTNHRPSIRYRPGWQSSLFCFPLSMVPARLVDSLIRWGQRNMVLPTGVSNQSN